MMIEGSGSGSIPLTNGSKSRRTKLHVDTVDPLGSGIRKKPIPDPGSMGQKYTGSRIRILNTGLKFMGL